MHVDSKPCWKTIEKYKRGIEDKIPAKLKLKCYMSVI